MNERITYEMEIGLNLLNFLRNQINALFIGNYAMQLIANDSQIAISQNNSLFIAICLHKKKVKKIV